MGNEQTDVLDPALVTALLKVAGDETRTLPRSDTLDAPTDLRLLSPLPRLSLTDSADSPAELRFEGTLGSGGMADVHLAVQPALDRTVAVKALKPSEAGVEAAHALVREGRITGSLEHPNIVPVHTLGRDEEGRPLLVMKRISGYVWHDLIELPTSSLPSWAPDDRLQWYVEIMMQVCNALSFAHDHGVLHRDLKPSNIMVGQYGEVYVLDWGIAVRLEPRKLGEPSERRIVGSPAYMAPEMLSGRLEDISARTDVYLLGATLHRVLTGVPRHAGQTPRELWRAIKASRPFAYDDSVPEELAHICNTATSKEPERRFASVDALRKALADFLRHRTSVDLSQEATRRLTRVEEALSQPQTSRSMDHAAVLRALGACRFGFMHALTIWEGNSGARRGLQRTLCLAVENELERGEVGAAERLMAEIEDPPAELVERVKDLVMKRAQARERFESLKRMEKDLDIDVSRNWRSLFTAGVALTSFLGPLLVALLQRLGVLAVSHTVSLVTATLMVGFIGALVYGFRKSLFRNKANMRLTWAALIAGVAFWLHRWHAMVLGLTAHQAIAGDTLLFAIIATMIALTVDARVVWAVPVYITASFSAAWVPSLSQELSALANLLGVGLIALTWWQPEGRRRRLARKRSRQEP